MSLVLVLKQLIKKEKNMIFLTGPHGAGKTTVAEILTSHNFIYLDLGKILRRKHREENPGISFDSWCLENERVKGSSFTDDVIVDEIKGMRSRVAAGMALPKDLVIVGSRSFRGIQYIIERIPNFKGCRNFIIYIDAYFDVLMERYCTKEAKQLTPAEFQSLLERDVRIGLPSIVPHADIKILNNSSMEELKENMQRVIFKELGYSK